MMGIRGWAAAGAALSALVLAAPSARADVISPEVAACSGKDDGEDCDVEEPEGYSGECVVSTCSRLDYSGDAGVPTSVQYECLQCEETSGCSIARVGAAAGPWLLALSVPLVVVALRRRRRR